MSNDETFETAGAGGETKREASDPKEAAGETNLRATRRRVIRHDPATYRLPPHSQEAEQGVLGCILQAPAQCGNACVVTFGADAKSVFYDLRHQTIYQNMIEVIDAGLGLDMITLQQRLKDKQVLEQVGGLAYLMTLPDATPSPANLDYYVDILKEKYTLRKLISTCTDSVSKAYEQGGDTEAVLDEVEQEILNIRRISATAAIPPIKEDVMEAINMIEVFHQRKGQLLGLETGFVDFDRLTGGLVGGDMTVIAARPSMGKTSLAMNIAEHIAIGLKQPVGIFSFEMRRAALVLRMLCSRARVNLRNIRDGFMAERDFPKLTSAAAAINSAPIHIDDTGGLTVMQLRARARRMTQQFGIKLFVVDYLQKLTAMIGRSRVSNRQQEVAEISNGLKCLAVELNVPVIVLCQLNRDMEKEKKHRKPRLSDLRESGAIEADADTVGLLYKPEGDDDDDDEYAEAIPINMVVAKQRNGPTGEIHFTFLKSFTRFENAARVSDEDIPNQEQQQTFDP